MSSFSWSNVIWGVIFGVLAVVLATSIYFAVDEGGRISSPEGAGDLAWGPHSIVFIMAHGDKVRRRHAHQARYWHRMWSLENDLRGLASEYGGIMVNDSGEVKAITWIEYRDARRAAYWASDIAR